MAGASSPLHNCCDRSSQLLSVSPGRYSYQFLSLPSPSSSSSSSSSSRRRHVSIVRASGSRGDRGPVGDTESKDVLNAFFLGKAVAESLTERVGTIVGEFLSDIGRFQAEQQKQIRDFQVDIAEDWDNGRKMGMKRKMKMKVEHGYKRIKNARRSMDV